MMKSDRCNCPHHGFVKLLLVLAWISGVLFFWASFASRAFWGLDASFWAWSVVVLVLLSRSMRCKCCCGDKHCNVCPVDKGMMPEKKMM